MSAEGSQGSSHESESCQAIDVGELANGIEEDYINRGACTLQAASTPIGNGHADKEVFDSIEAFRVTGCQNKEDVVLLFQGGKTSKDLLLFALSSTPRNEDRAIVSYLFNEVEKRERGRAWLVILEVPTHFDPVRIDPQLFSPLGILLRLHEKMIYIPEGILEEVAHEAIGTKCTRREASVDYGGCNAVLSAFPQEIGPEFGFDRDEEIRLNQSKGSP